MNAETRSTYHAEVAVVNGQSRRLTRRERRKAARVVHLYIGLGGTGQALLELLDADPSLISQMVFLDTDAQMDAVLRQIPNRMLLSAERMPGILTNKKNYRYLRKMPPIVCYETKHAGAGKIRIVPNLSLGAKLEAVKGMLHRVLQNVLGQLAGPGPKLLVVHEVFSLPGGSGSGAAIPVALLVRAACALIDDTLPVMINAHGVGPEPFRNLARTPADAQRDLVNAHVMGRELEFAQNPANLAQLCDDLNVHPMEVPLFDSINYYTQSTSGSTVETLDDIRARITANILGSRSEEMALLEQGRDCNPDISARGNGATGASVIGAEFTGIAQAPREKLAEAAAAQVLHDYLTQLLAPAQGTAMHGLYERALPILKTDQSLNELQERFRRTSSLQTRRLGPDVILRLLDRAQEQWDAAGARELSQIAQSLAEEWSDAASNRARAFLNEIARHNPPISTFRSALQRAASHLETRKADIGRALEDLALADAVAVFRIKKDRLRTYGWFGAKRAVDEACRAWGRVVETAGQQAAYRFYIDQVLDPLLVAMRQALEWTDRLDHAVGAVRRQLAARARARLEAIGVTTPFFTEIVEPDEVPGIIDRMMKEGTEKMGPRRLPTLTNLLAAERRGDLRRVLDQVREDARGRAIDYLDLVAKDLQDFIHHFELRFDLGRWIEEQWAFTLPCKLDLSVHSAANHPVHGYVLAPTSLHECLAESLALADAIPFELAPSSDPFAIVVRAKISRAPFCAIPGRVEMERQHREFMARAPHNLWGIVWSHPALRGALPDAPSADASDVP